MAVILSIVLIVLLVLIIAVICFTIDDMQNDRELPLIE